MVLVFFVFPLWMNLEAQEHTVRIAAAADLKFAMQEISAQFEKQTGIKADVSYGSSGNFFSQIQSGAPFDLFFSADMEYPRKLDAAGFGEPGTLFEYGVGRIVIWTSEDAKFDVAKEGWESLFESTVQKIAIANPEHAPYGRAAIAALQKAGIYAKVKSKLVYGENISQAAQFVQSGNAQAGILAKSFAVSPAMKSGKYWEIPPEMYPAIEQGAIVVAAAKNKSGALVFLEFIKSKKGHAILEKYGLAIPGSSLAQGADK